MPHKQSNLINDQSSRSRGRIASPSSSVPMLFWGSFFFRPFFRLLLTSFLGVPTGSPVHPPGLGAGRETGGPHHSIQPAQHPTGEETAEGTQDDNSPLKVSSFSPPFFPTFFRLFFRLFGCAFKPRLVWPFRRSQQPNQRPRRVFFLGMFLSVRHLSQKALLRILAPLLIITHVYNYGRSWERLNYTYQVETLAGQYYRQRDNTFRSDEAKFILE